MIARTRPPDDPGPKMVLVPQADADWLAHWRARCETGRAVIKLTWRILLAAFIAAGSIAYAINQIVPAWDAMRGPH